MRLIKIKSEKDIPDLGVDIKLQIVDNNVEAVVISNEGKSIRIVKDGTYNDHLKVLKQQPKEAKEVWFVRGDLLGLVEYCSQAFEHEYEASEHLRNIEAEKGVYDESLGISVVSETIYVDREDI